MRVHPRPRGGRWRCRSESAGCRTHGRLGGVSSVRVPRNQPPFVEQWSWTDPTTLLSKETAHYWLREAETRAGLLHQRQGGWHAFRRAWATARKHMPLPDVMAAGGWRDPQPLQRPYQHADGATLRKVMEADG